jgi:hypothetical protein
MQLTLTPPRPGSIWAWCARLLSELPDDPRAAEVRALLISATRRGLSADEAIAAGVRSISLRRVITENPKGAPQC